MFSIAGDRGGFNKPGGKFLRVFHWLVHSWVNIEGIHAYKSLRVSIDVPLEFTDGRVSVFLYLNWIKFGSFYHFSASISESFSIYLCWVQSWKCLISQGMYLPILLAKFVCLCRLVGFMSWCINVFCFCLFLCDSWIPRRHEGWNASWHGCVLWIFVMNSQSLTQMQFIIGQDCF